MRIFFALLLLVSGCSSPNVTDELGLTQVTFPNGTLINAETMLQRDRTVKRSDGLRETMPPNRGMLFIHPEENIFHYWMYQTKIPLDIIWMDHDKQIVEMSLDTPPCTSKSAKDCTNYGGNFKSKYVLEVNAGVARKNALKAGDTLNF